MRILLIEDDTKIASLLNNYLKRHQHIVEHTTDGNEGLDWLLHRMYDVAIIDWMLPSRSGQEICTIARAAATKTGMLMLTARGDIDDKISALRTGADDYLTKPFDLGELMARIEAVARRSGNANTSQLRAHNVIIDLKAHLVLAAHQPITLTNTEFVLLEFLIRNRGHVLSREQILQAVWDTHESVQLTAVDVYISYLRRKLHPHADMYVETIRGLGYRWSA
jgi:DNA-binding response OmpR family regulator